MNWGAIHFFDIILGDLRPRVGFYCILGLVGMFGCGSGGLVCVSDELSIMFWTCCIDEDSELLVFSHLW